MKSRITNSVIGLLFILVAMNTGCWNDSGAIKISKIILDPHSPVKVNSDVNVQAVVTGSNLTYEWTVTAGTLRNAEGRYGQDRHVARIAVTPTALDDFGRILSVNGLLYEEAPLSIISEESVLKNFDVLILNSSDEISTAGEELILQDWVDAGGVLYTSGKCANLVKANWPDKIKFAEPNPYVGSANEAGDFVLAKVISMTAAEAIGDDNPEISLSGNDWAPIMGVKSGVKTMMTANVSTIVNESAITNIPSGYDFTNSPVTVYFTSGKGMVMYTDFHYWFGQTGAERDILKQLAAIVTAGPLAYESHSLVDVGGYLSHIDFSDFMSQGDIKTYQYDLPLLTGISFVLNSGDGDFNFKISGPDGAGDTLHGSPPVTDTFTNTSKGTWKVIVECTNDQGNDAIPVLLTIATRSTVMKLVTTTPEIIWRTPLEAGEYVISVKAIDGNGLTGEQSISATVEL